MKTEKLAAEERVAHTPRQLEGNYVIAATGDGAFAKVVSVDNLHQEVHNSMCCCGTPWNECTTEGVTAEVARLDNLDNWMTWYPRDAPYEFNYDFEDGSVRIIHLSEPATIAKIAAHEALVDALRAAQQKLTCDTGCDPQGAIAIIRAALAKVEGQ